MKNLSETDSLCYADLVGEIVSSQDVSEVTALLSTAYGKEYATELSDRIKMLFGMMLEEGWTSKRFQDTAKWIVKNRPYPNWTISDWFNAPLAKIYPRSKYLAELLKGQAIKHEVWWWEIIENELPVWSYRKDGELPFKKIIYGSKPEEKKVAAADASDILAEIKKKLGSYHEPEQRTGLKPLEELI